MKKLFDALQEALSRGEDAVLVTIVASSGSAPRGTGARMLVTARGRVCGTIGGGAVEYKGEQLAAEILRTKRSRQESFRLFKNDVADLGMVCGGTVDVYFRFIPGGDKAVLALIAQCAEIFERLEPSWLITELTEGGLSVYGTKHGLLGDPVPPEVISALGNRPTQKEAGGKTYYCEKLLQPGKVYVFGGGHVAQALVPALTAADFPCVVLDDRPDFLRPELFGGAETRRIDPEDISDVIADLGENDYVCIMTRGHKDDMDIQRQVMRSPVRYIGVIGSAKKQRTVKEKILAMGYTEDEFEKVVSPIGLDIGAETPAELAVSITAQLIMVRAGKGTGPKDWKG
jgi:xanthine dehydrogenase accessory factor